MALQNAERGIHIISILFFLVLVLAEGVKFDVELRLSPRWVGGNIGSTDVTKTCHNLKAYIFETNNCNVINNTSLDSLESPIYNKTRFNPPPLNPSIQ
jgi:hypothetical protein